MKGGKNGDEEACPDERQEEVLREGEKGVAVNRL